jgi:hypothetical protein
MLCRPTYLSALVLRNCLNKTKVISTVEVFKTYTGNQMTSQIVLSIVENSRQIDHGISGLITIFSNTERYSELITLYDSGP